MAHAAKDDVPAAIAEQAAFLEARARVPEEAFFGNNTGRGRPRRGRELHARRDPLPLREDRRGPRLAARGRGARGPRSATTSRPTGSSRCATPLGAALLQAGRFAEAEAVFREDLAKLPENGWGLYGLSRALQLQKKTAEAAAVEKRFDEIWKRADLKIKSACLCLPGSLSYSTFSAFHSPAPIGVSVVPLIVLPSTLPL